MNTDIVLGIAKRVRGMPSRVENFHVVVASATIDPKAFIEFFAGAGARLDPPPGTSLVAGLFGGLLARLGRSLPSAEEAPAKRPLLEVPFALCSPLFI